MKHDIVYVHIKGEEDYTHVISKVPFHRTNEIVREIKNVHVFTEDELKQRDNKLIAEYDKTIKKLAQQSVWTFVKLCEVIRRTGDDQNVGVVWISKKIKEGGALMPPGLFCMGIGLMTEAAGLYIFLPLQVWENCWFGRELSETPYPVDFASYDHEAFIKKLNAL